MGTNTFKSTVKYKYKYFTWKSKIQVLLKRNEIANKRQHNTFNGLCMLSY